MEINKNIAHFFYKKVLNNLPFTPNDQQDECLKKVSEFIIASKKKRELFILKGFAGTGKTSLMASIVQTMDAFRKNYVLLAPTGRASQVLSNYSGLLATTIHKEIYVANKFGSQKFQLNPQKHSDTLFVVDEASMLSDADDKFSFFGSGNVMRDLLYYAYGGKNCKLLFLGDTAQLPPIDQKNSPALDADVMKKYDVSISEFTLTQVARQALESGILNNATQLRQYIEDRTKPFTIQWTDDVIYIKPDQILAQIEQSYNQIGIENTTVISYTNATANFYNRQIRTNILHKDDNLSVGDRIMISRNDYYWLREQSVRNVDFIANGDVFVVMKIKKSQKIYDFEYVQVLLHSVEYNYDIEATVCLDTLYTDKTEQNAYILDKIFLDMNHKFEDIHNKKERLQQIINNDIYSSLQARFAYATTCHKAQGGQWKHVYIILDNTRPIDTDYLRWLYTAFTRAIEKVYVVF